MDFETNLAFQLNAHQSSINLILWILKHNFVGNAFLMKLAYKFDPMDFETDVVQITNCALSWYKFDPMDFETNSFVV